jgi:hypothetical protein
MDSEELIYTKTDSGENAIQQRNRVLQRNVRMVLILVDGHSSVADLGRKIGNVELVEEALRELEEGGFIERKDPASRPQEISDISSQGLSEESLPQDESLPHDSSPEPERNRRASDANHQIVAERVEKAERAERAERNERKEKASPSRPSGEARPVSSDTAPFPPLPGESGGLSSLPLMYAKKEVELGPRFSPPPRVRRPETHVSEMEPDFDDDSHDSRREAERPGEQSRFPQAKPSFIGRLKSTLSGDAHGDSAKKPKIGQSTMKRRVKRLAVIFLGLVFASFLGFALFPFSIFAPDVEQAFSLAIGRPVNVSQLRVNIYPTLELVLAGVGIGQGKDAIEVREIRLQPEAGSWFSERKSFRKAVVAGTNLPLERIASLPAIFSALADPVKSPKIEYIQFEDTSIRFLGLVLRGADAEVRMDMGAMRAMEVRSEDRNLTLVVAPVAGGIDLTVEAFAWKPHAESGFLSDALTLKGRLEKDVLSISSFKIRIFDGLIQGDAVIRAGGAKPNVSGSLVCEGVNTFKLGEALGIGRRMTGNVFGKMRFAANSETWPEIFSLIEGEGDFAVHRGSVYGADLAEAMRKTSRTPVQGGVTTFEQMTGKMRLRQEKNQFYDLNIASGLMQSTGHVDVARGGNLSGRLELLMRGTLVPVVVSGTSSAPAVQAVEQHRPPG